MIDIHSHILPGIDDGSKGISETIKMGRIAESEGIKKIVATPHFISEDFETDAKTILDKIGEINEILRQNEINVEILSGHEAYLSLDLPEKFKEGIILPINKGPYILVEFPMADIPIYAEDILYELRLMGYKPIIAHPERYRKIIENPNILKRFIEQGNYTQINTMSIQGMLGQKVQETAKILLQHDMIHLIGTDCHSSSRRSPKIQKALKILEQWVGEEKLKSILINNQYVVDGKDLIVNSPKTYKSKVNFFYGLLCYFLGSSW